MLRPQQCLAKINVIYFLQHRLHGHRQVNWETKLDKNFQFKVWIIRQEICWRKRNIFDQNNVTLHSSVKKYKISLWNLQKYKYEAEPNIYIFERRGGTNKSSSKNNVLVCGLWPDSQSDPRCCSFTRICNNRTIQSEPKLDFCKQIFYVAR